MPPRKKKHPALEVKADEIPLSRRSSLRVNLSYVSNLSDSGKGSFRSVRPEVEDSSSEKSRITLRRTRGRSKIPGESNSNVSSKKSLVNAMSEKETALSESCRLLREAIMNKTREIFDGRAELAVKTVEILIGENNALKEINGNSSKAVACEEVVPSKVIVDRDSENRPSDKTKDLETRKRNSKSSRISRGDKSFILGGSDKSRDRIAKEKVLMVKLNRITDPRLEMSIESNMSDIGAPVTCSSFIAGHGNSEGFSSQRAESELSRKNSIAKETTISAEPSSLTPMEITAVQAPFASEDNGNSIGLSGGEISGKDKTSDNRSSDQVIPMELTSVQSHMPLQRSSRKDKTARTSLNVKVSKSLLSRTSKLRSCEESPKSRESISENDRTGRVSLKVNTSLETEDGNNSNNDSVSDRSIVKISRNRTIISDSDNDSVENMSLVARLRNLSNKELPRENRSLGEGAQSFVEGTPYPPSRSILWKSQIRSETIATKKNRDSTKRNILHAENSSKNSNSDSSTSSGEFTTAPNSTVIPADSPCRISRDARNPRIIEDSSEENDSGRAENTRSRNEDTTMGEKIRQRKLLPLRDNLEIVSFSPVSLSQPAQKKPITWKPRKHFRKRKNTRAVAEKRIEALLKENEDEDDEPARSSFPRVKTQKDKPRAKKPRKVLSKKIVVKKATGTELMEFFGRKNLEQSVASERSSTNEFLNRKRFSVAARDPKSQKLVIVATGFSKGDAGLIKSVVKELGSAEINSTVTRRTTHVVSTGVRTINLLRGIIRGCWLINIDWVLRSLEMGKWLNAEQYEMVHFSKAVQENRRDRQIFGKSYVPELFTTCGPIHVEHATSPPSDILKELVKTAGGRIADNPRDARLNIGPSGLREIWILDSITTGDLQPTEEYRQQ